MKSYAAILISVILIGTILFYPVYSSPTDSLIIRSSGKIALTLPLHVEGRYIKNSFGNTVVLRGINKHGFENHPEGHWQTIEGGVVYNTWDNDIVAANLDAMKSWGMNTVRSYSTAQFWIEDTGGHREIVKQYAGLLAERNMYLIYTFWHTDLEESAGRGHLPFPSNTFPDAQSFVDMWLSVASELKDYPNIIFALWNEPGMYDGERVGEWFTTVQSCIDAIRAAGAENLIIIQWEGIWINLNSGNGAKMDWVEEYPLNDPLGNLVYEFHSYRTGGSHKFVDDERIQIYEYADVLQSYQDGLVDYVLNTLNKPVICGEIGANMWQTGEELEHEFEFYSNALQIFNEWDMSYIGFWWWPTYTYAHLTGNSNYEPNDAGEILKAAISTG